MKHKLCHTIILLVLLMGVLEMAGCSPDSKSQHARKLVKDRVIIVLAKEPDLQSSVLDVQDFIRDGKSFVPFFSSYSAFKESTQHTDLGKPVYEIDRRLFVSIVHSQDILVLNPGLASEMTFTGDELKQIFPEPFVGE